MTITTPNPPTLADLEAKTLAAYDSEIESLQQQEAEIKERRKALIVRRAKYRKAIGLTPKEEK